VVKSKPLLLGFTFGGLTVSVPVGFTKVGRCRLKPVFASTE